MSTLHLDAEALYADLVRGVRRLMHPESALVGIWSGGAWLVERLQQDLGLPGQAGVISSALHRDELRRMEASLVLPHWHDDPPSGGNGGRRGTVPGDQPPR